MIDTVKKTHLVLVLLSVAACLMCLEYHSRFQYKTVIKSFEARGDELAVMEHVHDDLYWFFYEMMSEKNPTSKYTRAMETLERCDSQRRQRNDHGQAWTDNEAEPRVRLLVPALMGIKKNLETSDDDKGDDKKDEPGTGESDKKEPEQTSENLVNDLQKVHSFDSLTANQLQMLVIVRVSLSLDSTAGGWLFDANFTPVVNQASRLFLGISAEEGPSDRKKHEVGHLSANELGKLIAREASAVRDWRDMLGVTSSKVSLGGLELSMVAPAALGIYLLIVAAMYAVMCAILGSDASKAAPGAGTSKWPIVVVAKGHRLSSILAWLYLIFPLMVMIGVFLLLWFKPMPIFPGPIEVTAQTLWIVGALCVLSATGMTVTLFFIRKDLR